MGRVDLDYKDLAAMFHYAKLDDRLDKHVNAMKQLMTKSVTSLMKSL